MPSTETPRVEKGAGPFVPSSRSPELLVVDPGVENVGALLAGIRQGVETLYLSPAGDALGQIARHLANRDADLSGLHVLAHGAPGALHLAGERLDTDSLDAWSTDIRTIARALAPSAAVLIYGCSVGAGAEGRALTDLLSARLAAPVTTADGPVGSADLGGDWSRFDHPSNPVPAAFSPASRSAWHGLLAQVTLTAGDDTLNPGAGDDEFVASLSNSLNASDVLDGGDGNDTITISASHTVTLGATTVVNVEQMTITSGSQNIVTNDATVGAGRTLTVDASTLTANMLWNGQAEADGHFVIKSGSGRDTITGGALADTIEAGAANDTVSARAGDDLISGGAGNDTLSGGAGSDTIHGGADNDFLYGMDDNDTLHGGDGNDGVSGGDGDDLLSGGSGNDTLISSSGNDIARGGAGNDWIWGQKGDDHLSGGLGNDTVSGGDGADTLSGGVGNDTHSGGSGTDIIRGGEGADMLLGMAQADTLSGGAGADTLSGGADTDVLVGGADADVFIGSESDFNGDTIDDFSTGDQIIVKNADLSSLNSTTTSGTITLTGGQELTLTGITASTGTFNATYNGTNTTISYTAAAPSGGGSGGGSSEGGSSGETNTIVVTPTTPTTPSFSTTVQATNLSNTGSTGASTALLQNTANNGNVVTATLPRNTSLTSEGPATAQSGSTALNTLTQSIESREAPDGSVLVSHARSYLTTLAETTTLDVRTIVPTTTDASLVTPIFLTGTAGAGQTEAFVVDMRSLPTGSTVQLDNIEFASVIGTATVAGGLGSNFLTGDENMQNLTLGADNDTAFGGGGTDLVYGNAAADVLYGNQSSDTLFGGQDNDTLYGGQDSDVVNGNAASDILYGNFGNDSLYGGADSDGLYGGAGEDSIVGGDGNDALYGGKASTLVDADTLSGGAGDDSLYGGEGVDYLYGGDGADKFVIEENNGYDVLLDFDGISGDQIQIEANANGSDIDTFEEILANATTLDGNTEINLGGDYYIRLVGIQADQLQESWFGFF